MDFEIVELPAQPSIKLVARPQMLTGEIYKIKSPQINNSIYITIGYAKVNDKIKPYEIFINSKDLSKVAEYALLTRLISAIFRVVDDPSFIVEELKSIYDPNGGYFKDGKYMHSFYAEIADLIDEAIHRNGNGNNKPKMEIISDSEWMLCPKCNQKTAKSENGCITCNDPGCGYSKCDH